MEVFMFNIKKDLQSLLGKSEAEEILNCNIHRAIAFNELKLATEEIVCDDYDSTLIYSSADLESRMKERGIWSKMLEEMHNPTMSQKDLFCAIYSSAFWRNCYGKLSEAFEKNDFECLVQSNNPRTEQGLRTACKKLGLDKLWASMQTSN